MRVFVLLLIAVLLQAASVETKIQKTTNQLHSYSKKYKRLNQKMAKTAEAILKLKKRIKLQEEAIAKLQQELASKSSSYEMSKRQLRELQNKLAVSKRKTQKLQNRLSELITKAVSISILMDQKHFYNIESVIDYEILKTELQEYKKEIKRLNSAFSTLLEQIKRLEQQAAYLKTSIDTIDAKHKKLLAMQKRNKKDLHKLKIAKNSYKKALRKRLTKKDELKKTVAKRNVVKSDQERRKRQEQERKRAFENQNANLPKVKQYGKSYQNIKTVRYTGKKTIPPLTHYTITKKYGTYTDPIYGIKIFNESISMRPKQPNAQVRNVLNGKVIYAEKTAMLGNVVIIEHKGGIHTIYANLSKIAPTVKKGKKIKKGYVIGRVQDELIFEVTKKTSHVNPTRLFQ